MRWFVEISPLGQGPKPPRRLCVEAPQWQPALQRARSLAGSEGSMTNVSIELLDDGYRATDKAAKLRFVVRRAPDDEPLSEKAEDNGSLPAFEVVSRRELAPSDENPLTYREVVYAVAAGTSDEVAAALLRARVGEVRESLEQLDSGRLIRMAVFDHTFEGRPQREPLATLTWKDWRPESPEVAYPLREAKAPPAKPKPTAPEAPRAKAAPVKAPEAPRAKAAPVKAPEAPKAAPVKAPEAPKTAPVKAPEVPKASPPSPKTSLDGPKASAPSPKTSLDGPEASAPSPKTSLDGPEASAPSPKTSLDGPKASPPSPKTSLDGPKASPPSPKTPVDPPKASPPAKAPPARPSADDLLSELFEACIDMHFLPDPIDGAAFILDLALAKIPSAVGLVSFFDIDKREFVIVRQSGGQRALMARQPERAELAQAALRRGSAVVVADAAGDRRVLDERWRKIGVTPRSVVCAPADAGGRTLGLIEIADPMDGGRYTEAEGNALTYLGQQLAEFLAERGITLDPEAVLADVR